MRLTGTGNRRLDVAALTFSHGLFHSVQTIPFVRQAQSCNDSAVTFRHTAHTRVGGRGEPGFWQILGNVMNTSMLIGLVFVVLACVAFLFMDRINRSDMEDGRKKLITYGLFAGLVAISVLIFKLHSAGWIAERSVG